MTALTSFAISDVITAIGSIVTGAIGWVGTVIDTIEGEPLLLFAVLIPFVGIGISLLRRLFKTKA